MLGFGGPSVRHRTPLEASDEAIIEIANQKLCHPVLPLSQMKAFGGTL